jgi:hypothetical protein
MICLITYGFPAQCTAWEVLSEFGSFLWGRVFGIRGRCHICHQMDLHFHNLRVNDGFRHDIVFGGTAAWSALLASTNAQFSTRLGSQKPYSGLTMVNTSADLSATHVERSETSPFQLTGKRLSSRETEVTGRRKLIVIQPKSQYM